MPPSSKSVATRLNSSFFANERGLCREGLATTAEIGEDIEWNPSTSGGGLIRLRGINQRTRFFVVIFSHHFDRDRSSC